MKEFIEYILLQLVSKPDQIKVTEDTHNGIIIYNIDVAEEDMGLVIGKDGRTIRSVRSLVKAKAIKDGVRVKVVLLEKDSDHDQD
jgi:predicted RNA-binding protein YlqC (UPF0109 family)